MRRERWVLAAAAAVLVVAAIAGVALLASGGKAAAAPQAAPANTARVQRGKLAATVSQDGTLGYRARRDGAPFIAINQARGTYTDLPEVGDKVDCGGVLYRVDDRPVLLLCGSVPAYRALHLGEAGRDVRQLNRNLNVRGAGDAFSAKTQTAVLGVQRRTGAPADGSLARGEVVFLPEAVRVAKVTAEPGGSASPGTQVLSGTSDVLHVRVDFDASQQGQVSRGDRAQITLPGNTIVMGRVAGFGRTAQAPASQDSSTGDATVPTYISLDDPSKAGGLDHAPVGVQITTKGVEDALSVPVTALVGKSGGGFAVEVVRGDGRHQLVPVHLGLFDTGGGRVQVEGDLGAGDPVVVPAL